MPRFLLTLALALTGAALFIPCVGRAQDDDAEPLPAVSGERDEPSEPEEESPDPPPTRASADSDAADADRASESLDDPGSEFDAWPEARDRPTPRPARPWHDEERPPDHPQPERPGSPLEATMEVSIGVTPTASLDTGGLGGLAGLAGISGRTDFTFSADVRTFVGAGLTVAVNSSLGGAPITRLNVPFVIQHYFEAPTRGGVVPTLRVVPSFSYASVARASLEDEISAGGALSFGVGVTYFATEWFALRILGRIGGGLSYSLAPYEQFSFVASVGGDVGIVVRL